MIENLSICHIEKTLTATASLEGAEQWVLFETCQRQIFISMLPLQGMQGKFGGQFFTGEAAYSLLLNIVCGLESKVVGETEILGQFKVFVNKEQGNQPHWFKQFRRIAQDILVDAKQIRSVYLHGVGHRSYGALTAQYLTNCKNIAIVGGGQLAQKALPYLNDSGHQVSLFLRNKTRVDQIPGRLLENVKVMGLDEDADLRDAQGLLIAAPMPSQAIEQWVARSNLSAQMVVDLRAPNAHRRLVVGAKLVTLDDLFADIETTSEIFEGRIKSARNRVLHLSRERSFIRHYRPFGWEDICA